MVKSSPAVERRELAAAVVVGAAAAIAAAVSGELSVWRTGLVTLLASVSGWATVRLLERQTRLPSNAVIAAACAIAAVGVVLTDENRGCAPDGVACFVGGCDAFGVYAQNRYEPLGVQIRAEPRPSAIQVGSMAPNKQFAVDGWVRTQAAYPHNGPPFDSDVWFHVADASGWVSFAGVRADPTTPAEDPFDPEGGRPAPIQEGCGGSVR